MKTLSQRKLSAGEGCWYILNTTNLSVIVGQDGWVVSQGDTESFEPIIRDVVFKSQLMLSLFENAK